MQGIRGIDFSYINPFIFLRPVEASNGSPDNALIGLTSKYKILMVLPLTGSLHWMSLNPQIFFSNTGVQAINMPGSLVLGVPIFSMLKG